MPRTSVASLEARIVALESLVATLKAQLATAAAPITHPTTLAPASDKPAHDAPFAVRQAWAKAESKRTGKCVTMP